MHYGIGAPEKWAPTLESPPLMNIRFSFASVYFSPCPISPSLIHLLPILINYIRRKFQATISGLFLGKKLHLKSWFQAKNFWPAAMSSDESKESLSYDEVTSWRSDALKLYCRQGGLKVSESKQELVARVFDFTSGEHLLYPCDCLTFSDWSGKKKWTYKPSLYVEGVCAHRSCRQNSRTAQANLWDGLESI